MIDFDIRDLLEREDRRQKALNTGSRHIVPGPRWQGARADAVSELDVPELLWPSERRDQAIALLGLPPHCWNCGAGRAGFETHPPYGLEKKGESVCMTCSRVVARWRDDKTRPVPTPPVTEPVAPNRGRPVRAMVAIRPPSPPCPDCNGRRVAQTGRARCQPCAASRVDRGKETMYGRMLAALASGYALRGRELADRIGVSTDRVRHLVHLARERGVPIRTEGKCYRLVDRP